MFLNSYRCIKFFYSGSTYRKLHFNFCYAGIVDLYKKCTLFCQSILKYAHETFHCYLPALFLVCRLQRAKENGAFSGNNARYVAGRANCH